MSQVIGEDCTRCPTYLSLIVNQGGICEQPDLAATINFNFGLACGKRDSRVGNPLFEMCCFLMGIACKGGGGAVKACQDGLGHFFSHVCLFDRGGGSKAIWAMPI